MAYIGLEPKFSYTPKYSTPFELVLCHVIHFAYIVLKVPITRIY